MTSLMGLKSHLTPLSRLEVIDAPARATLSAVGVTTVEELAGMLEADSRSVCELIGWTPRRTLHLRRAANALLDPAVRRHFREQQRIRYPLGALDPREPKP